MMNPYWIVMDDLIHGTCAFNADADTDMGNLYGSEFHTYFPKAVQITEKEFVARGYGIYQ
jgi:hypothetical protein